MTVIRPNSVSGITSITAQANDINFFRSNGTLAGLNLNGVNFNTTSGVSTFAALNIEGVLTYQDVTNVDSVGVITARSGIRIGATGANTLIQGTATGIALGTGTPRQKLHINASDSGASNIVFTNATTGTAAGDGFVIGITGGEDAQLNMQESANLKFSTADTERLRITSTGRVGINQTSPEAMLQVDYDYNSSEVGLRIRSASGSGTKTWQLSEINGNAGVFTIRNTTNSYNILNIDGANQRVGINDTTPDATLSVGGATAFIDVGAAGGNRGKIGYTSNDLYFGTSSGSGQFILKNNINSNDNPASSGTERLRIIANGAVGINTSNFSSSLNNEVGLAIHGQSNDNCRIVLSTPSKSNPPSIIGYYGLNRLGIDCHDGVEIRDVTASYATRFKIDQNGLVTKPDQPFVMAHIVTTTNRNSSGSQQKVPWDVIHGRGTNSNVGSHFDTSNNRFTAPIAGRYLFVLSLNEVGDNIVYHRINNTQVSYGEYREGTNKWNHMDASFIYDMNANDYYETWSLLTGAGQRWNGGGSANGGWDTLSIYLLG